MLQNLLKRIFDISPYTSRIDRERAILIYGLNAALLMTGVIFASFSRNQQGQNLWQQMFSNTTLLVTIGIFVGTGLLNFVFTRQGRLWASGLGMIFMWVAGFTWPVITATGMRGTNDINLVIILILLAGFLGGNRGIIAGLLLSSGLGIYAISRRAQLSPPGTPDPSTDIFNMLLGFAAIGLMTYLFIRYAQVSQQEGASAATTERLKLAELTTAIVQGAAQRQSVELVLNNTIELIRLNYPKLYHVQIFLIDDTGVEAKLVASTGEVGRQLIVNQHSLTVGSRSVIGQVTSLGQPIIARTGSEHEVHRRNELLPNTVVEAAFPLRVAGKIIGALDLQSTEQLAFTRSDISSFQSLADSVAIAIDNVQLVTQAEQRLQENQLLIEQTNRALSQVQELNARLTGQAWQEFLRSKSREWGVTVDFATDNVEYNVTLTPTLNEASRFNHLVQDDKQGVQVIAVPLRVRGQVVGAMEFEVDNDRDFTPEDINLLQEVSERFGMAAESTRLLEESQRVAQREALVNQISTRLQTSTNIDTTLAEAARSLRDTLQAHRVTIRLGSIEPQNGNGGAS